MTPTFGRSGAIPFRSTATLGQAYKPINKATIIRNKFFTALYGNKPNESSKEKEDAINTNILSAYCIMDVAYGIWQELIKKVQFTNECEDIVNEIKLIWSNDIYSKKNVFYKDLTDNEIYELSEYSDKLAKHIQRDIRCLYNNAYSIVGFLEERERDAYSQLFVISLILTVSMCKFKEDWKLTFIPLEHLYNKITMLTDAYIAQHNENAVIQFKESIYKVIDNIYKKINNIRYES